MSEYFWGKKISSAKCGKGSPGLAIIMQPLPNCNTRKINPVRSGEGDGLSQSGADFRLTSCHSETVTYSYS